jgi:hypothetical protein
MIDNDLSLVQPLLMAGAIEVYDNAFDPDSALFRRLMDSETWERAKVGTDNVVSEVRTSSNYFLSLSSLSNPVDVFMFGRTLYAYLNDYGKRYDVAFAGIEDVCINRYEPGQSYRKHSDAGPGYNRVISALVYLNDVASGGETVFTLFDEAVTPRAGRLVIFPSNYAYAHEARPPAMGIKYSLAAWAVSL